MAGEVQEVAWTELPFVCPHCGNHGQPDGAWESNAWTPFRLIEEAVRSWPFTAVSDRPGLRLSVDTSNDSIDWESGTNLRIECMQCYESFPLPEGARVEFE